MSQPSIIFNPDDNYSINYQRPTQIPLPFDLIRPLKGTLEEWVIKFNRNYLEESKKSKSQ